MKTAFSASRPDLEAKLDSRFGRAQGFLIVGEDGVVLDFLPNQVNNQVAQGAGIQAAALVVRSGATALVTGHCGPKAFRVLEAGGVTVFTSEAATVREALHAWRSGCLVPLAAPNVEGHW